MSLRIFITGATDGIGLETAKKLKSLGHKVIVHGRNRDKLKALASDFSFETFHADLSDLGQVNAFTNNFVKKFSHLDVLINNAGVFKTPKPLIDSGMDVRFMVNTIAPYLITKKLLPIMKSSSRVINLSSAAQAAVDFNALLGKRKLSDFEAYAQSKLAITMWSQHLAEELKNNGPIIISVNPGSLLSTKMVKEGFGTQGNDINIGVNILTDLATEKKYENSTGLYLDNDAGHFAVPQADGLDRQKKLKLIEILEELTC